MTPASGFSLDRRFAWHVQTGYIAPYVLVPGSKSRVRRFAALWDHATLVTEAHEFLIYSGELGGTPLSACSTGIGGTSVAVAVQELIALGAHTLVRVGVTGTLQEGVAVGDLTVASAAIRADRISDFYVPPEIPALASHQVVLALVATCQKRKYTFHVGVTATNGTFYCGEGRSGANGYAQSFMASIADDFRLSGVLDWDTETATLFSLASSLGVRAGRINAVMDSPRSSETDPQAEERAMLAALEAVSILADWTGAIQPRQGHARCRWIANNAGKETSSRSVRRRSGARQHCIVGDSGQRSIERSAVCPAIERGEPDGRSL